MLSLILALASQLPDGITCTSYPTDGGVAEYCKQTIPSGDCNTCSADATRVDGGFVVSPYMRCTLMTCGIPQPVFVPNPKKKVKGIQL